MATGTIKKNMVKLWENPSPTASFAAQKVSLDLSEYALVLILFRGVNQSGTGDDMSIVGTVGSNVYMSGTAYHAFKRNAQIATDGVEFFNGYFNGGYGTADWRLFNTACIPTAIYGIRA